MAKGLFLRAGGGTLSGGSAGIGVPVLKRAGGTLFPSLERVGTPGRAHLSVLFRMNLAVRWRGRNRIFPRAFTALGETLVSLYVLAPRLQRLALALRDALLAPLAGEAFMEEVAGAGLCAVEYRVEGANLTVSLRREGREEKGRLVAMNEGGGSHFTVLRSGGTLLRGSGIPGWTRVPPGARFESPAEGVAFAVRLPGGVLPGGWRLHGGREVAAGLDWAGFALSAPGSRFEYGIAFERPT